jgi:ADP-ribose pyrophosphatase
MRPGWHVDERVVYETPWWRLYNDGITAPDGSETTYIWARTTSGRGAVMCIPRTEDGRFLLIRIYRHPIRRDAWEFVAGLIDEGETPKQAAIREVAEEIGVQPSDVHMFPPYVPVSGFIGDQFHVALATIPNVGLDDLQLQAEEGIAEAQFVDEGGLKAMVKDGRIEDGITLVALAHLWASRETR